MSFDDCTDEEYFPSTSGSNFTSDSTLRKQTITRRELRTRTAFLAFSFIVLVCVPFILVFSFGPMKEANRSADDITLVRHIIIDRILIIVCRNHLSI
jgi:hypothetical protein